MRIDRKRGNNLRITAVLLAALMIFTCNGNLAEVRAETGASVRIGHAVTGERGRLSGNRAGDGTGREAMVEDWTYSIFSSSRYHWKCVLRAKDHELARAIASDMQAICDNDKIGYDQKSPDKTTMYEQAEANGWDFGSINKKCETTCSNAISACLNAHGIKVAKNWNTKRMKKDLLNTGEFECFETKDYTASPDKLVTGDILLYPGRHTAVVTESSNPFTYKLTYINEKGDVVDTEIEEDKEIWLDPNNGKGIKRIKMDEAKDVTKETASLRQHEFAGWQKSGKRFFMAYYRPQRRSLELNTQKIKVQQD